MRSLLKGEVMTYTVCGGDDDRTGDKREAIVHADLECGFPAMTTRKPETFSRVCSEQWAENQTHKSPLGSAPNCPGDCSLFPLGPKFLPCKLWRTGCSGMSASDILEMSGFAWLM
jgi:hypothetical protein